MLYKRNTILCLDVILQTWDDILLECLDLALIVGNDLLSGSLFVLMSSKDSIATSCQLIPELLEEIDHAADVLCI